MSPYLARCCPNLSLLDPRLQVELEEPVPYAPSMLMSSGYAFQIFYCAFLVPESWRSLIQGRISVYSHTKTIYKDTHFRACAQVRGFVLRIFQNKLPCRYDLNDDAVFLDCTLVFKSHNDIPLGLNLILQFDEGCRFPVESAF